MNRQAPTLYEMGEDLRGAGFHPSGLSDWEVREIWRRLFSVDEAGDMSASDGLGA